MFGSYFLTNNLFKKIITRLNSAFSLPEHIRKDKIQFALEFIKENQTATRLENRLNVLLGSAYLFSVEKRKLKFILSSLDQFLVTQGPRIEKLNRHGATLLFLAAIASIAYVSISSLIFYYDVKKRVHDEYSRQEFLNQSVDWLGYITGRYVLYNAKITKDTANLLSNLCVKPSTQHLINKSLRGLFEMKIIFNGTETLLKNFLHRDFFFEDYLYSNWKKLMINQCRKEHLRRELMQTIINYSRSEPGIDNLAKAWSSALYNQGVIDGFVNATKMKAWGIFDGDHYKNIASEKLKSFNKN